MKLRDLLVKDYLRLKSKLVRRVGSADLATEILHETYLRLSAAGPSGVVNNPDAYLYRAALNVAADSRDEDRRWMDKATIEGARRRDDYELDPEEIFLAQQEWRALLTALDELPPRRRAVFLAARLEELPHREIAKRLGVSIDTVDRELKQALRFFGDRLGRIGRSRRGSGPVEPSKD